MILNVNLLHSYLLILYLFTKTKGLQVCLDNCAYKIANNQMTNYPNENLRLIYKIIYYKCCITTE